MKRDYDRIKDVYGEKMARLCRFLFPTFLERDGWLFDVLSRKFAPNHYLCDDIVFQDKVQMFKDFIYSFDYKCQRVVVDKTVEELFDEEGYNFYECPTYKDIYSFKNYYREDELLCTFYEDRLSTHHVFWAVKKNADDIQREENPVRDGDYGTSVISIQFSRGLNNSVSIKNRYNHHVENSDATFCNNLDNIAEGLTNAFERQYGFHIDVCNSVLFDLDKYVRANDGKYYRFNLRIHDVYYCPNNIVIDNGEVISFDTSRYLIIDYFIIDMKEKKILLYDCSLKDSFMNTYKDFDSIKITKNENGKVIRGLKGNREFFIYANCFGEIIGLDDENLSVVNSNFLHWNEALFHFNCPSVRVIEDSCLSFNKCLEEIDCSNVISVGNDFLKRNFVLREINLDNVRIIGNNFLYSNRCLDKLILPKIVRIGDSCLYSNEDSLKCFSAPSLCSIGDSCFASNCSAKKVDCKNLEVVGRCFMYLNKRVKDFYFPRLSTVKEGFFGNNKYFRIKKEEALGNFSRQKKLGRYKW